MTMDWAIARRGIAVLLVGVLSLATGCANFFPPLNGTGSPGTANTGDYAYVISSYTSTTPAVYNISGFSVSTAGALTALSGLPLALTFAPTAIVVNPANSYLYVAGLGVIVGYTIASDGSLTSILNASNGTGLANSEVVSMDISPDGKWLVALDSNGVGIDEFQIGSTGLLTALTSTVYTGSTNGPVIPSSIRFAPTGSYAAIALGTGGDALFSFDKSTGALTQANTVNPPTASSADQALVFDSTGATLYVARSGTDSGVVPYLIGSNGTVLTPAVGAPFSLGTSSNATGPASIVIDSKGQYLYVGNKTSNTISGFSIGTAGVLTTLAGSPYTSGTSVNSLGRDNSGSYIFATALGGTPDLEEFSLDATTAGKLDVVTTAPTGDTSEPAGAIAVALTH
jgi:6-phosphogluconolactonase (cycloisomerase 2 family)